MKCKAKRGGAWVAAVPAVLLLGMSGCLHDDGLVPAATGGTVVKGKEAAVIVQSPTGVGIQVAGDSWDGYPLDLQSFLTPVKVTITNNTGRPLKIRHADFNLVGTTGFKYSAIPADKLDRPGPIQYLPSLATYPYYYGSPYYYPVGPYYPYWAYPPYYDYWVQISLPTPDMLSKMLPEGTLNPGAQVTGYVYFEDVSERESGVTFKANIGAPEGRQLAAVEIPFVVK